MEGRADTTGRPTGVAGPWARFRCRREPRRRRSVRPREPCVSGQAAEPAGDRRRGDASRAESERSSQRDEQFAENHFVDANTSRSSSPSGTWQSRLTRGRTSVSNGRRLSRYWRTRDACSPRRVVSRSRRPKSTSARTRGGTTPDGAGVQRTGPDPERVAGRREIGLPRARQGGPPGPRWQRGRVQACPGSVHHCKTARVWCVETARIEGEMNTCHCIGTHRPGRSHYDRCPVTLPAGIA